MIRTDEVSRILAAWIEARAGNGAPDPEALIRSHPELADDLRAGLEGLGALELRRSADAAPAHPRTPDRIGDYRIVREIGRGGMGVVYEAEQLSMQRRVALKVLTPSLTNASKAIKRFRREAQTAGRLHHTNIVPVFGMGQEGGYWYYAMELVEGRALSQVLDELRGTERRHRSRHALDLLHSSSHAEESKHGTRPDASSSHGSHVDRAFYRRIAQLFADVADALHAAHEEGVVHRDVKPGNLLLDADGTLKIVDFGLAHLDRPGHSMTLTGDLVGTPAYMSPEQAVATRAEIDRRTDVYSLGATLYELMTLHPPFEGETLQALCSQIVTDDPALPHRLEPRVPKDLETIVLKAMEKERTQRFQRAGDFAADLRRFATGHMIRARRIHVVERAWRKVKRHPTVSILATVAVLAVTIGATLAYRASVEKRLRLDAEYELSLADAQFAFSAAILGFDASRRPPDHGTAASPDQSANPSTRSAGAQAVSALNHAIELVPHRPEAWWLRALLPDRSIADRLDDLAAARERGLDPSSAAHVRRYIVRSIDDEHADEVAGEPQTPIACFAKAVMLGRTREWRDGEPLLDRAITESRSSEAVHVLARAERAGVRRRDGRHESALEDWFAIEAAGQTSAILDAEIAVSWRHLGEEDAAEERFERALVKATNRADEDVWLQLTSAIRGRDRLDWLERVVDLAIDTHPDSTLILTKMARTVRSWSADRRRDPEARRRCALRAVALCDAALAIDPTSSSALSERAFAITRLFQDRGEHALEEQDVVDAWDACRDRHPGEVRYLFPRAFFLAKHRPEQGLEAYDEILTIDPEHISARTGRIDALMRAGRFEEAIRVADDEIARMGSSAEYRSEHTVVHWMRGVAHLRLGRPADALPDLRRAALANPEDKQDLLLSAALAMINDYGVALERLGRHEEALEQFERMLARDPDDLTALRNRIVILNELGQHADALAAARSAVSSHPSRAECQLQLGDQLALLRDWRAAAQTYQAALELGVDRRALPRTLHQLGHAHLFLGQNRESFDSFRRALELEPKLSKYNPACAALRVSAEETEPQRASDLRHRALRWLRAEFATVESLVPADAETTGRLVDYVAPWTIDADLAPIRGEEALAALPEEERAGWAEFWRDVEAWLTAQTPAAAPQPQAGRPTEARPASRERVTQLRRDSWAFSAEGRHVEALAAQERAMALLAETGAPRRDLDLRTLARALSKVGRLDEALTAAYEARDVNPADGHNHCIIAEILHSRGESLDALPHLRRAVELSPDVDYVHVNCLTIRGRVGDALGSLLEQRRWEDWSEVIEAQDSGASVRCEQLAAIAQSRVWAGDHAGALAAFRRAAQLEPLNAYAHLMLGIGLHDAGRYGEAAIEYRAGMELLDRSDDTHRDPFRLADHHPDEGWLEQVENLARREARLEAIVTDGADPADTDEYLAAAAHAHRRQWFARAVELHRQAAASDPARRSNHDAACAATLAGFSMGVDADLLDARAELRRAALDWLRADLANLREELAGGDAGRARQQLTRCLQSEALAPARDEALLGCLPDDEADAWRSLWEEIRQTLDEPR